MRRKSICLRLLVSVAALIFALVGPAIGAKAKAVVAEGFPGLSESDLIDGVLERSGAGELYDSLDDHTRDLLDRAGVEGVLPAAEAEGVFRVLSSLLREKLTGPLTALASLTAVIVLCRLAGCFDGDELGGTAAFAGALACAALVVTPLLRVLRSTQWAVEAASAFLIAAVPVYGGLMIASGSPTAGTSYSLLALSAGNLIPILSSSVIFPILRAFLSLALVSCVAQGSFTRLAGSLYGFAKWLLVLSVTAFSGVLSVQTALNAHVDAAANKAVKLVASAAIPIVGSAFGDAAAAIQNSVGVVKSGVGAFGMIAAAFLFAPSAIEAVLWSAVCSAGQIVCDLFEAPGLGGFLGMCASAAKMILAVIAATCAVALITAAVLLFIGGNS